MSKKAMIVDGTIVQVEDVPINRKLIKAGAIVPEDEREERPLTPEELEEEIKRADKFYAQLEEIDDPEEPRG